MLLTLLRRVFRGNPKMISTGTTAPSFRVQDHHGAERSLEEFAGKRLVLWFYPKADTPG